MPNVQVQKIAPNRAFLKLSCPKGVACRKVPHQLRRRVSPPFDREEPSDAVLETYMLLLRLFKELKELKELKEQSLRLNELVLNYETTISRSWVETNFQAC